MFSAIALAYNLLSVVVDSRLQVGSAAEKVNSITPEEIRQCLHEGHVEAFE
jgi:hypothetical protein